MQRLPSATVTLALVVGTLAGAVCSQTPQPNVLSLDNETAGPTRTGDDFGPAPVGGVFGSISLDQKGATHEQMRFVRGAIPPVGLGGPELVEINLLGQNIPHEHVQDIEPIGDWSNGAAYFAVTHSQDNSGHFFVLKTTQVAAAPNEHEVYTINNPSVPDGQGVWWQKFTQFSGPGQYNHPGDMSAIGNILVIAGQNWPGHPLAPLQIGQHAEPDAVLFYDVANPENPVYLGKIRIGQIAPHLVDLSDLWAGKIGDHYYMTLGDGNASTTYYSSTFAPNAASWSAVAGLTFGAFIGDTILTVQEEGNPTPIHWSIRPQVDDYLAVSVRTTNNGSVLQFSNDWRTYDVADSAFAAAGSAAGAYVSPRGRMTQIAIDRGFDGYEIEVEANSIHYGRTDVLFPPVNPLAPFSDVGGWGSQPGYFQTIQTADIDGDGRDEILARDAAGLAAIRGDGSYLPGSILLPDPLWLAPEYYSTIQAADIDGDGRDEVLARFPAGVVAFEHDGAAWQQLPGFVPLSDAQGFNRPEYYSTIQTGDIDGDGTDELLVRTAFGLASYSFDGAQWLQLPDSIQFTDATGWDNPRFYETIQIAELDDDGREEVIARSVFGVSAFTYVNGQWVQRAGGIPLSDATGWAHPQYYRTIQPVDLDGDGRDEIMARFASGLVAFRYDGQSWTLLPGTITEFSNASGGVAIGDYGTIQSADFDGDGQEEVIGRYFWGVVGFEHDGTGFVPTGRIRYLGSYNRYEQVPYSATMQCADLDGDGRAEFLARLRTGLFVWPPEDLGFGRALPMGVARVGVASGCLMPDPRLDVDGRPTSSRRDFRLIAQDGPANGPGVQVFAGGGPAPSFPFLGATLYVNLASPFFLTLPISADAIGRADFPLPIWRAPGLRFSTQTVWLNQSPCAAGPLSSTPALDITVQ